MTVVFTPSYGEEIARALASIGSGLSRVINPNQDIQRQVRQALLNPEFAQSIAAIMKENPNFLSTLTGSDKFGSAVTGIQPTSAQMTEQATRRGLSSLGSRADEFAGARALGTDPLQMRITERLGKGVAETSDAAFSRGAYRLATGGETPGATSTDKLNAEIASGAVQLLSQLSPEDRAQVLKDASFTGYLQRSLQGESQRFQAGERALDRTFSAREAKDQRVFQAGEAEKGRSFQATENTRAQALQHHMHHETLENQRLLYQTRDAKEAKDALDNLRRSLAKDYLTETGAGDIDTWLTYFSGPPALARVKDLRAQTDKTKLTPEDQNLLKVADAFERRGIVDKMMDISRNRIQMMQTVKAAQQAMSADANNELIPTYIASLNDAFVMRAALGTDLYQATYEPNTAASKEGAAGNIVAMFQGPKIRIYNMTTGQEVGLGEAIDAIPPINTTASTSTPNKAPTNEPPPSTEPAKIDSTSTSTIDINSVDVSKLSSNARIALARIRAGNGTFEQLQQAVPELAQEIINAQVRK